MTDGQVDALYDFLDDTDREFSLREAVQAVKAADRRQQMKLASHVADLITSRRLAFSLGRDRWITRKAFFSKGEFVITPTRFELREGIFIPGHRCMPFANPELRPREFTFFWEDNEVPVIDMEGSPEDFYPYYYAYGEEYGPQYITEDRPENEEAYNAEPYGEPLLVTMRTIDMRQVYREAGFTPGDSFLAKIRDWKEGSFSLTKIEKDEFSEADKEEWARCLEEGFFSCFKTLGGSASTEEQIAFAYWFAGERAIETPAYSLEDFLYDKTDKIETVPFGVETRFWYAGKEIPDFTRLEGVKTQPNFTQIEDALWKSGIPVSEYVLQAYTRDALFYHETDTEVIARRIAPVASRLDKWAFGYLEAYIADILEEWRDLNIVFSDQYVGPLRRKAAELHTALIDLASHLEHGKLDRAWLPSHIFIELSQLQQHTSLMLEDMCFDDEFTDVEIESMNQSIDAMTDFFEVLRLELEESIDNFRRSNITLLRNDGSADDGAWRTVQLSIGGADVWRRVDIPQAFRLEEIHLVIQAVFNWQNTFPHRFTVEYTANQDILDSSRAIKGNMSVQQLADAGITEVVYEYGRVWTVRVIMLTRHESEAGAKPCCLAGANEAPPESVEGPLRFRRFLSALEEGEGQYRTLALSYLGENFGKEHFDVKEANERIKAALETR